MNNVDIIDLSLEVKGLDEDKEYSRDKFLRLNIRRGNSILKVMVENSIAYTWGRYSLLKIKIIFLFKINNLIL